MISFQVFSLSNWILSSCGLSLSFLNGNSGPFHHLLSETNPLADMPRDRISAGFWLPGQNLHDSGVVCTRISCTLLMTYCFQGLKFFIQHKTVIEWTKNTVSNFWGKAFCTVLAKRTRIVVPYSSSLGMLCFFNGSTIVFDSTNFTSSILINGANINACNVSLFWSVTETVKFSWFQIARRVVEITSWYTLLCVWSSRMSDLHSFKWSPVNRSSQSVRSIQSSWNKTFHSIVSGLNCLTGSNILAEIFNNDGFVVGSKLACSERSTKSNVN